MANEIDEDRWMPEHETTCHVIARECVHTSAPLTQLAGAMIEDQGYGKGYGRAINRLRMCSDVLRSGSGKVRWMSWANCDESAVLMAASD